MSTSFDSFLPHILPHVPGCSDQMAYQALRNTAIDFCRRTDIVQVVSAPSVVAAQQDYAVTIPTDMAFQRLKQAFWQGVELVLAPPPGIHSDVALRGVTIGTAIPTAGSPKYAFQKTPTTATISLYPIPDTVLASGLTFKCSFIPSMTALTLDDSLFSDWVEALAAGTLARLVALPQQAFSMPAAAGSYAAVYERAVAAAKRQSFGGKLGPSQRVTPVQFSI